MCCFKTAILERCRHRSIRNVSTKIHGTGRWDHLRKSKLMILLNVISRWWQLKYFFCSPRSLGNRSNLTNNFQMGWFNHQPVQTCIELQSEFFMNHRWPHSSNTSYLLTQQTAYMRSEEHHLVSSLAYFT